MIYESTPDPLAPLAGGGLGGGGGGRGGGGGGRRREREREREWEQCLEQQHTSPERLARTVTMLSSSLSKPRRKFINISCRHS